MPNILELMNFIYRIFVRPYESYASVVWWTKVHQKNLATSLSSLQRLACIGITETLCAAVRLQRTGMWRTSGLNYGHSTILERSQFTDPKVLMPSDHIAKTYHFNMRYKTLIPNQEEWVNGFPPQLDSSDLVIYTDSSKMNSSSGVGIYSEEINLKASENLGEFATAFQTEIVAITLTAREILHRNNKRSPQDVTQ